MFLPKVVCLFVIKITQLWGGFSLNLGNRWTVK